MASRKGKARIKLDPVPEATNTAFLAMSELKADEKQQAIDFLAVRLNVKAPTGKTRSKADANEYGGRDDVATLTPKEFMKAKRPDKAIEKVATLAYYLRHHREQPSFETKDLTALNDEAQEPKFTSASMHIGNALKAKYLTTSGRGQRTISRIGEELVDALPDRDAVRAVIAEARKGKRRKRSKGRKRLAK